MCPPNTGLSLRTAGLEHNPERWPYFVMEDEFIKALGQVRSFRQVDNQLGTSGQPTETQFADIRKAGFEAVINLALPVSTGALPNEGSIVTGLGMPYVHLPVDFKAPRHEDFRAFSRILEAFAGRKVFVHCAANMRVSAFVFLHRVLRQGVLADEARKDLLAIWEPDEVWSRFIEAELAAGS